MIEGCLAELSKKISNAEAVAAALRREAGSLSGKKTAKLEQAMTQHLIHSELQDIAGIGERLASQILQSVYRDDIRDLRHAGQVVRGVGRTKQANINAWVRHAQARLLRPMGEAFPERDQIVSSFAEDEEDLTRRVAQAQAHLEELCQLKSQASGTLSELTRTTTRTFRSCLAGEGNAEELTNYLRGVFAPWEAPPQWFVRLQEECAT